MDNLNENNEVILEKKVKKNKKNKDEILKELIEKKQKLILNFEKNLKKINEEIGKLY